MLTTVYLHGQLARRFGARHRFDIRTPGEATAMLEANRPGFRNAVLRMRRHVFIVRVGKRRLVSQYLQLPHNGKAIHITPILEGAASGKGIIEVIAGVVLIAAGIVMTAYGVPFGAQVAMLGIALVTGGVATLLAPSPPQTDGSQKDKNKPSYLFSGAVNTMNQGGPVQTCFGEGMFGSNVISADVVSSDIQKGSSDTTKVPSENTGSSLDSDPSAAGHPAYLIP